MRAFEKEIVRNLDGQTLTVGVGQKSKECSKCGHRTPRVMVVLEFGQKYFEADLTVAQARSLAGSLENAASHIGCDELKP